jgi:hypothetical protein
MSEIMVLRICKPCGIAGWFLNSRTTPQILKTKKTIIWVVLAVENWKLQAVLLITQNSTFDGELHACSF